MTGRKYSNRRVFPEQEWYEKLRPMLLFGQTAASRAKETGTSERTLHYKADQFEQEGMVSLFPNERTSTAVSPGRNLPEDLRQLIVDLHAMRKPPGFPGLFLLTSGDTFSSPGSKKRASMMP
jgi:hypothetical protein